MTEQDKDRTVLSRFDPSDYSSGSVLNADDGHTIENRNMIGAALSLYFNWPEHREAYVYFNFVSSNCQLSCDHDARNIEGLTVHIAGDIFPSGGSIQPIQQSVTVRFVVFDVCYEFTARILHTISDADARPACMLSTPTEIIVHKRRRLPRYVLGDSLSPKHVPVVLTCVEDEMPKTAPAEVVAIGLNSIVVNIELPLKWEKLPITLLLGGIKLNVQIIRRVHEQTVLSIAVDDPLIFGAYFDFYIATAKPFLKPRKYFPYTAALKLYEDSGYFSTFGTTRSQEQRAALLSSWTDMESRVHDSHADYYIVDRANIPSGISGVALSHFDGGTPVWCFHQLCAIRNPDLLLESGELYNWRAEYLAARPGDLEVFVSFRSKSRWIERLYTKHILSARSGSELLAVVYKRVQMKKTVSDREIDLGTIRYGKDKRLCSLGVDLWGGCGPRYLNANGNLDTIIVRNRTVGNEDISNLADSFMREGNVDGLSLLLTAPIDYDINEYEGEVYASDRLCTFPKGDLINLMSSIVHSVAVTQRKWQINRHE